MTNQQILEKAVQKAINGGWDVFHKYTLGMNFFFDSKSLDTGSIQFCLELNPTTVWFTDHETIIYNHDFAKALWSNFPTYIHAGFERYDIGKDMNSWLGPAKEAIKDEKFFTGATSYTAWQYHLQMMVINPDPIKYLGEHLNDTE